MSPLVPLIVAPIVGSFIGTIIRRLPEGRDIIVGRSACVHCDHLLAPVDLIPLVSYVANHGTCRHCGTRLSTFYPLIELAATAIAGIAVLATDDVSQVWTISILGWWLLALAWIDAEHLILPEILTLPLVAAGLAASAYSTQKFPITAAIGAASGYAAFRGIAVLFELLTGKAGLGGGDAKLLAGGGAWLGWRSLSTVVLLASLFGIVIAIVRAGKSGSISRTEKIPFGPCLALAIWVAYLVSHSNLLTREFSLIVFGVH